MSEESQAAGELSVLVLRCSLREPSNSALLAGESSLDDALLVTDVTAAPGWAAEVEDGVGIEVEVDFRGPDEARATFNAELEDGMVRIRIRER